MSVPIGRTGLVIQSRESRLALVQTDFVRNGIQAKHPDLVITVHSEKSFGDKVINVPLAKIGEKGLFTKELEEALVSHRADIAVHSLKDVPTTMPEGLVLGAILERHDPCDAVVMRSDLRHLRLCDLPAGAVVGTSSLRRRAMLSHYFPYLNFKDVRGNVQTRLRKLEDPGQGYSALVLAVSGLQRLSLDDHITEVLKSDHSHWYGYAVGQGALAVQCRTHDSNTMGLFEHLNHSETAFRCQAERSLMHELEGGCHAPIAVETTVLVPPDDDPVQPVLRFTAAVYSLDGKECIKGTIEGPLCDAVLLGKKLAAQLKGDGAAVLLERIQKEHIAAVEEHRQAVQAARLQP